MGDSLGARGSVGMGSNIDAAFGIHCPNTNTSCGFIAPFATQIIAYHSGLSLKELSAALKTQIKKRKC